MTSTDYSSVDDVRQTRSTSRQHAQISVLTERVAQLEKEANHWKSEYERIFAGRDDIMTDINRLEEDFQDRFEEVGRIIADFQRRTDEMIAKKEKWKSRAKAFERRSMDAQDG